MPGLRRYAVMGRVFGGGAGGDAGRIPHGALPMGGGVTRTALTGAYATSITTTSVAFRWTGGGSGSGANALWIASTVYPSLTGNYAFTTAPTYNGTDYGGLSISGLTTATQYTYYLWVSDDNGDGPAVSVTFTTL